ncbi:hypothetical protein M514_11649 [Trichuris suis]|uniref:Uncharacterized protein n=1 Tax=Trichuris suis TaxID=68888 RepID=A0A085MT07_9BILA|nr:hypothetical protein M513_11649 [Trichuris suis]KFD60353.1 hypothetical protein M514_11649 [Trichuris suis]
MGKEIGFKTFFKSSSTLRAMVLFTRFCAAVPPPISEKRARLSQHLSCLNHYKKALSDLQGKETKRRVRPRKTEPHATMDEAIKASAIVEHVSHCNGKLFPKVICHEENFKLRKIKENLFIRHNEVINRDKGKERSDIWTNLIRRKHLCKNNELTHFRLCNRPYPFTRTFER